MEYKKLPNYNEYVDALKSWENGKRNIKILEYPFYIKAIMEGKRV